MFSLLTNVKKFSNKTICIADLVNIVVNNPQKNLIDKIRSVEYKSKEYNKLKLGVSCVMPHGIFNGLLNDNIISLSNYLFYDIDGINDINELNDTISRLINTFPISFLQRSVSNKGFHFLIKVDDTLFNPNDTIHFINVYRYVRHLLVDGGFNIDNNASGLARKMIISSDVNVYLNNKVSLGLNKVSLVSWLNDQDNLNKVKIKIEKKEGYDISPNDTIKIIDFKQLLSEIKTETKYEKPIIGDFIIEDMDYYRIVKPNLYDGNKHKSYSRIINALYYINGPEITKQQIYSYLYHINMSINNRMNDKELLRIVNYVCDNIIETGEIRLKNRVKKLHFNINCKLNKNQKMSMGAKLSAKIKQNKSIELITKAKNEINSRNEEPTRQMVANITGLGIATVKRNWNKQLNNLSDIEVPPIINELNLEEVNEEVFFSEEIPTPIKFNYRGFEEVTILRYDSDKIIFKDVLNHIQSEFGAITERDVSIILNSKYNWDKYLINFFWSGYENSLKKQGLV